MSTGSTATQKRSVAEPELTKSANLDLDLSMFLVKFAQLVLSFPEEDKESDGAVLVDSGRSGRLKRVWEWIHVYAGGKVLEVLTKGIDKGMEKMVADHAVPQIVATVLYMIKFLGLMSTPKNLDGAGTSSGGQKNALEIDE